MNWTTTGNTDGASPFSVKVSLELQRIARDFRRLSRRFEDYARRSQKVSHLAVNVYESQVRAGRLLVAAIDAGAFPKSSREKNGEWWDRREGRLPGRPFCVLSSIRWKAGDPSLLQAPEYLAAAAGTLGADQVARIWTFAIGSWLVRAFSHRLRHNAAEYDRAHVATDEQGYPVGRDGKRILGRWYKSGKPLPTTFKGPPRGRVGKYEWRRDRPLVIREELYDKSDWLAHLRVRAEVYSDACLLLSELIRPAEYDRNPSDLSVQYVTRSQAAATVNRSARTFEHYEDMPNPTIPGGKGRPAEWEWHVLRPWLEKAFRRNLPARFPADRFDRR